MGRGREPDFAGCLRAESERFDDSQIRDKRRITDQWTRDPQRSAQQLVLGHDRYGCRGQDPGEQIDLRTGAILRLAGLPRDLAEHVPCPGSRRDPGRDRKSTRLNSSHLGISYAVFCLKKKKNTFLHVLLKKKKKKKKN